MIQTTNLESEYKVKFKVRLKGLFSSPSESIEIYEASSAQEAIKKCEADFNDKAKASVVDLDDVKFSIVDVEKL